MSGSCRPLTYKSFRIPQCVKCGERCQRDTEDNWHCPKCADEWLRDHLDAKLRGKSIGGVVMPTGVADPRRATASFRDILPNRAARRRAR